MNKLFLSLIIVSSLFLSACNDPSGEYAWPDGATMWLSGVYADSALSWSPYGDVLFFSAYVSSGASRLFGTDGLSDPSDRTFTSFDEFMGPLGAWNSESARIVYTALNPDSMWSQIRSIPGNETNFTIHIQDSLMNAFPTYNVAGDSILYCSQGTGNWQLYLIDAEHTPDSLDQPIFQSGFPAGDILRPSYSPSTGQWVLFQHRATPSDDWDIMIAHPDGSNQKVLSASSSHDIHPSWGPDDQWVIFSSNRTGNYELFITNTTDDVLIQVTDDPALDQYPAWNPTKQWIAFSSDRASGNWNLDIFAIDEPELP